MGESESTNGSPDPRTAEVLRVVQRAKGTVTAELAPTLRPPDLADGLVAEARAEDLPALAGRLHEAQLAAEMRVRQLERALVPAPSVADR